jgi:hypothetical protein
MGPVEQDSDNEWQAVSVRKACCLKLVFLEEGSNMLANGQHANRNDIRQAVTTKPKPDRADHTRRIDSGRQAQSEEFGAYSKQRRRPKILCLGEFHLDW